ncbi:class I SAM-dependent methyltransferase [Promethearchaeum syntrophicum]|uniref:Class I SAM-dependent methyltransferase n=1 Tax=Promethearchaeum syntrophicum TaxID=2594042 RepID=A0A5B9DGP2_9ARCH|nr:class I SAM-dependent methyltransferase [Candidatus Prometheoarchaeum syntrophicum]QEE17920.1 hypothetical protein DSAG12_03758 [Candidatus Prometheoarchaeum syntrophicum]
MGKLRSEINVKEWEQLPWYDLLSKMGLESFNWRGLETWNELMNIHKFPPKSKILIVGCGVGKSAFYLAEKFDLNVTGIDIAEKSIEIAKQTATGKNLEDKVKFQISDAHELPFHKNEFDGVFTEYMAYFLDHPRAFKEFHRVLKPSGYVAFNELMLESDIPKKKLNQILEAGTLFEEIAGFKLNVPFISDYEKWCTEFNFKDIQVHFVKKKLNLRDLFQLVGGFKNFRKITKIMLYLWRKSPIIKKKFKIQRKVKWIVFQKRSTAKYIRPTICIAQKGD